TPAAIWTPLGKNTDSVLGVDDLVITGVGVVAAPAAQMPIHVNDLEVQQGAVLTSQPTNPTQEYSLLVTVANTLTVDSTSAIDVSGAGYMDGYTLGDTTTGAAQGWAAGSYGGYGNGGASNAAYGDYRDPNNLGSGGSNGNHSPNQVSGQVGAGGGLMR